MAEAAGLVLGGLSLLASFQVCLSTYDQIVKLKHKNDDLKYFLNMLKFEQHKLAGLMPDLTDVTPEMIRDLIKSSLEVVQRILVELQDLLQRHTGAHGNSDRGSKTLSGMRSPGLRVLRAAAWVGGDGPRIESLINRLGKTNDQLSALIPKTRRASVRLGFMARSVASSDVGELRDIQVAARKYHDSIALAADVKASRIEEFASTDNVSGKEIRSSRISSLNVFEWLISEPVQKGKMRSPPGARFHGRKISLVEAMELARVYGRYSENGTLTEPDKVVPVLVEWREGFRSTKSPVSYQNRLDQLVHVLQQMGSEPGLPSRDSLYVQKELASVSHDLDDLSLRDEPTPSFGILPCLGWTVSEGQSSRVGLIFRLPQQDFGAPISLHDRILQDRACGANAPALGIRFGMALGLAQKLANLIVLGWVHKAIRSDNIIMVDAAKPEARVSGHSGNHASMVDVAADHERSSRPRKQGRTKSQSLYLTGFSYAKPGPDTGDQSGLSADLSVLPNDSMNYILYRPPRALASKLGLSEAGDWTDPNSGVSRLDPRFDIYALGIVLLEIGLWRTVRSLYDDHRRRQLRETQKSTEEEKDNNSSIDTALGADEFVASIHLNKLVESLAARTGSIYQEVVSKCLRLRGLERSASRTKRPTQNQQKCEPDDLAFEDSDDEFENSGGSACAGFLQGIVGQLSSCKA